ncbi:putative apyrase 7 [Micractinium conductrix]|uniref:Apyrase 7 n=1 Tax=Micractinium conductrix TaxID=554055 RepID=A0A2P6VC62_9CHLO|nr:putative apyrase 7 [Micractinium conductrix]|eukprot:PSC71682.1 putative apyrase 7 [Micractinium conductrix]
MGSGRGARRRLGTAVAGVLSLLVLLALVLATRPGARYVLVIDAGSSGTRMYAYTWRDGAGAGGAPALAAVPSTAAPHKVPRRALPGKRAYQRVETEPGLDRFLGDEAGLEERALGPLLEWAAAVVPRRQWARTPVFLFGTAGLRKLSEQQQAELLQVARRVLGGSAFRFQPPWARIISGTDEGVFGWVALNYLEGRLQAAAGGAADTLGALDLGGSSMEVTFAAGSVPWQEDAVNATLLGTTHELYAHVHHHYGLNDAFDRGVTILLDRQAAAAAAGGQQGAAKGTASPDELRQRGQQQQQQAGEGATAGGNSSAVERGESAAGEGGAGAGRRLQAPGGGSDAGQPAGSGAEAEGDEGRRQLGELPEVAHPCLHQGYRQQYCRLRLEGAAVPVPEAVELVGSPDFEACRQLAHAVVNASVACSAPPCALGTPQPSSAGHRFVALTGFYVVYRFYKLEPEAPLAALEEAGRAFCAKGWDAVQADYAGELMVEDYCFRAPYIAALVSDGLLLSDSQLRIGGGDVGWTLGAALEEGYRLAGLGQGGGSVFNRSWATPALWFLAGAGSAAALLRLAAERWRGQRWPRGPGWLLGRGGVLSKLQAKGSAELISLGLDTPPSTRSSPRGSGAGPGLPSLVYPGSLSSRSASPLPSGRSAGWLSTRAASQQAADGGEAAAAAAVGEASLAGSPSWAAQVAAPVAAADGGGSGPPGVPRESSYSSNLNRLGRSGHFSRRSASALASPEPLD